MVVEGAALLARFAAGSEALLGFKGGTCPSGGSVMSDVRRLDSPLGTRVRSQIELS